MLEVVFLIWFARKLSAIATEKGRSGGWGGLGVLFWIGGEGIGGGIGFAATGWSFTAYLLALVGASAGAVAAYMVVQSLGRGETGALGAEAANRHYDPSNPYSPPRGGDPPAA